MRVITIIGESMGPHPLPLSRKELQGNLAQRLAAVSTVILALSAKNHSSRYRSSQSIAPTDAGIGWRRLGRGIRVQSVMNLCGIEANMCRVSLLVWTVERRG